MFFQLSRGALEKVDGLAALVDADGLLPLHDSQQARLVAQLLTASNRQEVVAWQVLAAVQLKALYSHICSSSFTANSYELTDAEMLQPYLEDFQSSFSSPIESAHLSAELLSMSLLAIDPALDFLTPLLQGISLIPQPALQHILQRMKIDLAQAHNLWELLSEPMKTYPHDLLKQLESMRDNWDFLSESQRMELVRTLNFMYEEIEEEQKRANAPERVLTFKNRTKKQVDFQETEWKKNFILIAKNANVWLVQLSHQYGKEITRLDQIPVKEIELLSDRGINSLWLIGIWERSPASRKIKELYGRTDTAASAYSIKDYRIAARLGGEAALDALVAHCNQHNIKLCVDMVPNHTGIDSTWLLNHPDWYISVPESPVADFHFNSPDLSPDPHKTIILEDGYYDQSGAAEVFLFEDHDKHEKRYIYHGNDGTSMPWNDTAQLDYLNPQVREQVMQTILCILKKFPLVRFDAAMTLTKKHFQRLWYPLPENKERCIPTRENHPMSDAEFSDRMPYEFWREVVERVNRARPDTVLMAEAFWLMEGFFINELGMHCVYNSAFMNLLRDEENDKYQQVLKNALRNNPAILGRLVNFLNNPDERTAADQFGTGDKYFAICTMLATMPGLPMLGHGQLEGLKERYGMDFMAPQWDEQPDEELLHQHEKWLFPLLHRRAAFSDSASFYLFEVVDEKDQILEDVYAYLNLHLGQSHLILVNNSFNEYQVRFRRTVPIADKNGSVHIYTLSELMPQSLSSHTDLRFKDIRTEDVLSFDRKVIEEHGLTASLSPYRHIVWEITCVSHPPGCDSVSH